MPDQTVPDTKLRLERDATDGLCLVARVNVAPDPENAPEPDMAEIWIPLTPTRRALLKTACENGWLDP